MAFGCTSFLSSSSCAGRVQDQLASSWTCAKSRGVSKDIAVPLAEFTQPWLPVLRPCRLHVFAQGLRDLAFPAEDDGDGNDFPSGVVDAEWRVELRIPDAADALLAEGGWFRHKQLGCVASSGGADSTAAPAAKPSDAAAAVAPPLVSVDLVDQSCVPPGDTGSAETKPKPHARYTPWELSEPPSKFNMLDESVAEDARPTGITWQRTASAPVLRSGVSVVLTGVGRRVNPQQPQGGILPRDVLRRLCLTNPQVRDCPAFLERLVV